MSLTRIQLASAKVLVRVFLYTHVDNTLSRTIIYMLVCIIVQSQSARRPRKASKIVVEWLESKDCGKRQEETENEPTHRPANQSQVHEVVKSSDYEQEVPLQEVTNKQIVANFRCKHSTRSPQIPYSYSMYVTLPFSDH